MRTVHDIAAAAGRLGAYLETTHAEVPNR